MLAFIVIFIYARKKRAKILKSRSPRVTEFLVRYIRNYVLKNVKYLINLLKIQINTMNKKLEILFYPKIIKKIKPYMKSIRRKTLLINIKFHDLN